MLRMAKQQDGSPPTYILVRESKLFSSLGKCHFGFSIPATEAVPNTEVNVKTIFYSIYNLLHIIVLKLTRVTMHIVLSPEYYLRHFHSS